MSLSSKIKKELQENGFVIIDNCVNNNEIDQFFSDVLHYLKCIPRNKDTPIPNELVASRESLTSSLSPSLVKLCRSRWLLHQSFGAPVEATAFHLPIAWHLRQRKDLFDLYSELYNTTDLLANIDRFCCKLPGSGETEFIHIDRDPHYYQDEAPLQSMIFFSDSQFYAIPKSHSREFHKSICDHYTYISKQSKPRSMTMIDRKRDILNLEEQLETIQVPKGSLLIWSENLWHASKPNKSDQIRFALYYGFCPRNLSCMSSDERLESYITGRRPKRFPSGQPTYLVPNRYKSYPYGTKDKPSMMQRYLNLIPNEFHGKHIVKKTGTIVSWLDEEAYDPRKTHYYTPYPLTDLGKKLLS